jgi:hypothetical protein
VKLNKKSTKDNPKFAKVQEQITLRENPPTEKAELKPEMKKKKNPLKKAAGIK